MDKNTQQSVSNIPALIELADRIEHMDEKPMCISRDAARAIRTAITSSVPRDVLMAALVEYHGKVSKFLKGEGGPADVNEVADRYASQVQPGPVNQQLLAALKRLLHKAYKQNWQDNYPSEVECAEAAIAAAEAAQPVAQQYLLGGRRFKVTHSQDHGFAITGLPQTMNGQWVAFVDATDNCHMQQQHPASAQPVADLDLALFAENQKRQDVERQRDELLAALEGLLAEHAVPSSGCKDRPAYEQALAAIAVVKEQK